MGERGVGGLVFEAADGSFKGFDGLYALDTLDGLSTVGTVGTLGTPSATLDLETLSRAATALFDDQSVTNKPESDPSQAALLPLFAAAGQVNGTRPKALLQIREADLDGGDAAPEFAFTPRPGFSPWIVKFPSKNFPLGVEEPIWEATALAAARAAGVRTQDWRLLTVGDDRPTRLLALRRFDRSDSSPAGRRVFVSAAGLLDVDFREQPLDLCELLGLTYALTKSAAELRELFRRAVFDVLIRNDDNHAKNVGFLLSNDDRWSLAPAFDVTFSASPLGRSTSFFGAGGVLTPELVRRAAAWASLSQMEAQSIIEEVAEAVEGFVPMAFALGASVEKAKAVDDVLRRTLAANARALGL